MVNMPVVHLLAPLRLRRLRRTSCLTCCLFHQLVHATKVFQAPSWNRHTIHEVRPVDRYLLHWTVCLYRFVSFLRIALYGRSILGLPSIHQPTVYGSFAVNHGQLSPVSGDVMVYMLGGNRTPRLSIQCHTDPETFFGVSHTEPETVSSVSMPETI